MRVWLTIVATLIVASIYGQSTTYKITGKILAGKEKTPLEAATIHLEKIKDSAVVSYTISDKNGAFSIEGKTFQKELQLFVSFVGYQTYSKKINFSDKKTVQLGNIALQTEANLLDEVVIKSRAPVTVKKDTLEFNVKSFKTKKNANVEDLLKKLPGVEVDAEGKITVNGKPVNKILVNGKPFFGNDPTITTKNLTKDIIEKVQITDTKTKSEAFSGEKGDKDNKTINLTIKKENNKGWFGRISAGGGTDNLYETAAMVNRFNNDRRISVLAGANNTNSPGFSFGEIERMYGGGGSISFSSGGSFAVNGRSFGGGSGLTRSRNIGVTFADDFGKSIEMNGDYFHSGSNTQNKTTTNRENILPDRRYFSFSQTNSTSENDNHNIETDFDIEIDSTFLINVSPSFTFNKRSGRTENKEESRNENRVLTNASNSIFNNSSKANNFSNDIDITKRIGNRGSFLKFSIENQIDKTDGEELSTSKIEVFGTNPSVIDRNQQTKNDEDFNSFRTDITYRYPVISQKLFLDFRYAYRRDKRENVKSTFDFDPTTNTYSRFNSQLSSDFVYNNTRKTPSLRIVYNEKKWSARLQGGYVFRTIENEDKLRPNLNLKRDFEAFELRSNVNYRFSTKAFGYMGYNLNNRPPSLNQIQPFTNVTNPLNIIRGNPNLKPTNNHNFNLGFNQFNFQNGTQMFIFSSFGFARNQVVSKSNIDANLVRTTTYENVNGNYNASFGGSYGKRYKLDETRTLRVRLGTSFRANKNINFFNDVQYSSRTMSFTPNLRFTFTWKDVFRIEPRYSISFSKTDFSLSNFQNQNFTRHNVQIRTRTMVPKKLEWRNDIRYNYNPNIVDGFQKSSWFWNSTVSYSMFKDKGTLSLKAYDILNQNTNARRTATANYIQDSESTVLQRYFMLSFSWKFNTLGSRGRPRTFEMFH